MATSSNGQPNTTATIEHKGVVFVHEFSRLDNLRNREKGQPPEKYLRWHILSPVRKKRSSKPGKAGSQGGRLSITPSNASRKHPRFSQDIHYGDALPRADTSSREAPSYERRSVDLGELPSARLKSNPLEVFHNVPAIVDQVRLFFRTESSSDNSVSSVLPSSQEDFYGDSPHLLPGRRHSCSEVYETRYCEATEISVELESPAPGTPPFVEMVDSVIGTAWSRPESVMCGIEQTEVTVSCSSFSGESSCLEFYDAH